MLGASLPGNASLVMIYRPRRPGHYVARLGHSGWLEGWGWTPDEALASLASAVVELPPKGLPEGARDHRSVFEYLSMNAPPATLDE